MTYTAPTPSEARQIISNFKLSGSKVAEQTGMKNSRKVREFQSDKEGSQDMPYSILFTLVAKNIGLFVTVDGWYDELVSEKILHQKKPDYMTG